MAPLLSPVAEGMKQTRGFFLPVRLRKYFMRAGDSPDFSRAPPPMARIWRLAGGCALSGCFASCAAVKPNDEANSKIDATARVAWHALKGLGETIECTTFTSLRQNFRLQYFLDDFIVLARHAKGFA